MEKTIKIAGKEVKLKATASFGLKYKAQFGRDIMGDLMMVGTSSATGDYSNFDSEAVYQLTWCMAKNADDDIPELAEWLDSFDYFPIIDVYSDIEDLLMATITTPKSKAKKEKKS